MMRGAGRAAPGRRRRREPWFSKRVVADRAFAFLVGGAIAGFGEG
jgi:hypothetical protein